MRTLVRRGADPRPLIKKTAARLLHAAELAQGAAEGAEPLRGYRYIADTLRDLAPVLRHLRSLGRVPE